MHKKIVFTGGGTAGHVTPNIELIRALREDDWQAEYIGSADGVEKNMIEGLGVPYHTVSTGKLRRYFSWKNFLDPFRVLLGFWQAYGLLRRLRPQVVFSKGGFVAFPVVVGAWLNRIPVVAHESDLSPGLANRLSFPFVSHLCVTFLPAKAHFKSKKNVTVTGTPIRQALFHGSKEQGLALCGFDTSLPILLVMGGSQGAQAVNNVLRQSLPLLTQRFQVIHLCGKGKVDASLNDQPKYCQFDYADETLPNLLAASDVIVSRAGANALYEILALAKSHVLIPLSERVSRGDQVQNARYFEEQGISIVLSEDRLTEEVFLSAVLTAYEQRNETILKIQALDITSATEKVVAVINANVTHPDC